MNEGHHACCSSEEWRTMVREQVIPWVVGTVDLGDDVLEVGPGFGATTDVLREQVAQLTTVEIDPELAAALTSRMAGTNVEVVTGDARALAFPDARFSGAASFSMLHHVPSSADQDRLFSGIARVLRPGAAFVASDSLDGDDLRAFHEGDTFVPVDPVGLPDRLAAAGFDDIEVRQNEFAWAALARRGPAG